jgi:hypothetical protein
MNSLETKILTKLNKERKKCTPHVGFDITTFAPGKYRFIRAAPNRKEPVPERPWTVATWVKNKKKNIDFFLVYFYDLTTNKYYILQNNYIF